MLSGGRLDLGVGVGWQREEYEAAGLDFARRGRLLDHTLEVCQALWREQRAEYDSRRADASTGSTRCRSRSRPSGVPIWVSGTLNDARARPPGPLRHRAGSRGVTPAGDLAAAIPRMRDGRRRPRPRPRRASVSSAPSSSSPTPRHVDAGPAMAAVPGPRRRRRHRRPPVPAAARSRGEVVDRLAAARRGVPRRDGPQAERRAVSDLEARLARLEAERDVAALMATYARLVDEGPDADAIVELFTARRRLRDVRAPWSEPVRRCTVSRRAATPRSATSRRCCRSPPTTSATPRSPSTPDAVTRRGTVAGPGARQRSVATTDGSALVMVAAYHNDFVRTPDGWRIEHVRFGDLRAFRYVGGVRPDALRLDVRRPPRRGLSAQSTSGGFVAPSNPPPTALASGSGPK